MSIARKDYECALCHTSIHKGEQQESWAIKPWDEDYGDGTWQYLHMHENCWNYLDKYYDASSEGWDEDWLYDIKIEIRKVFKVKSDKKAIEILKGTDWLNYKEPMAT